MYCPMVGDSQLSSHPRFKIFFSRVMSPSRCRNGECYNGGSYVNTTPLSRGNKVEHNRSSDPVVESVVEGTRVRKLGITALSQAHIFPLKYQRNFVW